MRKNERSSEGDVVTEREGGSQLWAVKGREVSIVRVAVVSEEIGRLRVKAAEKGLKRLDPMEEEEEEDKRDRAILICYDKKMMMFFFCMS